VWPIRSLGGVTPRNTIDVVIFNCVINLSVAKPAVLAETYCVLAPGGRIGIPDVIAEDDLTTKERAECGSYAGYITEAFAFAEYHANPATAGFTTIEITPTTKSPTACIPRSSAVTRCTPPSATLAPSNPPPQPNRHPPCLQLAGPMCTLVVSAGCWQGPPLAGVQQVQPVQQPSVVESGVQRVTALGEVSPPLKVQRHDVPGV
jgi:hypothetical protein